MSGLLRRIRRPGAAEETRREAVALPEPAHGSAPETAPVPADGSPLPAGVSPEDLERRRSAGRRGRMRRRARFLRRARELALRDLGGLVYEAARRDQDGGKLVKEKVAHLGVIDSELRALEAELGTPQGETVLREPGVGGTCPRCGELHASDAHFCSRCGLDLTAVPAQAEAAAPVEPAAGEAATPSNEAEAKSAEPTAGASADGTQSGEATPAGQSRRAKRWWRRSPGSEAMPAQPETSGASAAQAADRMPAEPPAADSMTAEPPATDPKTAEPPAADPKPAEPPAADPEAAPAPAAEQPTTPLAADGNGRATNTDALDPERSA